jgi:hypothetical protein
LVFDSVLDVVSMVRNGHVLGLLLWWWWLVLPLQENLASNVQTPQDCCESHQSIDLSLRAGNNGDRSGWCESLAIATTTRLGKIREGDTARSEDFRADTEKKETLNIHHIY